MTDVGEASQPFIARPSQSRKPPVQLATVHAPDVHDHVALLPEHARPQVPQLAVLVAVFVSQLPFMSQSACGAVHPEVVGWHEWRETSQYSVIASHASRQEAQSVIVSSGCSHPLACVPSQSAQPRSQSLAGLNEHAPAVQACRVTCASAQRSLQSEQSVLVPIIRSQPSVAEPLQSRRSAGQLVMRQSPATHARLSPPTDAHVLPQKRQFALSVVRSTSQPSETVPLQFS